MKPAYRYVSYQRRKKYLMNFQDLNNISFFAVITFLLILQPQSPLFWSVWQQNLTLKQITKNFKKNFTGINRYRREKAYLIRTDHYSQVQCHLLPTQSSYLDIHTQKMLVRIYINGRQAFPLNYMLKVRIPVQSSVASFSESSPSLLVSKISNEIEL